MPLSMQELMIAAVEGASEVLEDVYAELKASPPSREELGKRFEDVLASPDPATAERLKQAFMEHFGEQQWAREWDLLLRREKYAN